MPSGRAAGGRCVFCDIVAGARSACIVLDDARAGVVAFLDHRPLFPGHTLVVPRAHVPTLVELEPAALAPFFTSVQRVTRAVTDALGAEGSFVATNNVVSQSVPHLHVHVVPRREGDGLRGFFWPRHRYESEGAMAAVGAAIRGALERP